LRICGAAAGTADLGKREELKVSVPDGSLRFSPRALRPEISLKESL